MLYANNLSIVEDAQGFDIGNSYYYLYSDGDGILSVFQKYQYLPNGE